MTAPSLHAIRPCLEGAIPAVMSTCASDGTPNVAYISQVVYVDEGHVALSFQFFNKTRANILANPQASVLVLDPVTARFYRLHLRYLRTETHGALFESMKARLAGIASHEGSTSTPLTAKACRPRPAARGSCTACASAASAWRPAPVWTICCRPP